MKLQTLWGEGGGLKKNSIFYYFKAEYERLQTILKLFRQYSPPNMLEFALKEQQLIHLILTFIV